MVEILYGGQIADDHPLTIPCKDLDEFLTYLENFKEIREDVLAIYGEILCSNRGKFIKENHHVNEERVEWLKKKCKEESGGQKTKMASIVCRRCAESVAKLREWEVANWLRAGPLMIDLNPDVEYLRYNFKLREINVTYLQRLAELLELMS